MNFKNTKKGFTLIELLVVIAIIGLLATLAVVALGNARLKSRDAKRVSDIKQVQTALELRFVENDNYPYEGTGGDIALGATVSIISDALDISGPASGSTYMGLVPKDPSISAATPLCTSASSVVCAYAYAQSAAAGANSYEIWFFLEGATGGLQGGIHCASENGIANSGTCV